MTKAVDRNLTGRIQELVSSYRKGYRSNPLLDEIRPHAHEKQRWFLQMDQREILYGGAAGGGKQLYTGEAITYWRDGQHPRLGIVADVKVGDTVIGSSGKPTTVLAISLPETRQFFRVYFDDGTSLIASDNHRWLVYDLSKRAPGEKARGTYQKVMTTIQLSKSPLKYRDQNRFAIPLLGGPVSPKVANRPRLSPYVIGYWLGNGSKNAIGVTCHDEDADEICSILENELDQSLEIRQYDPETERALIVTNGLYLSLKALNWSRYKDRNGDWQFDKTKIPCKWQLWSAENRLALAQGLMDSGGHANTRGDYEFDNTNLSVTTLLQEVLQSLGLKPSEIRQKKVRTNEQMLYRICGTSGIQLFRLTRKADRLNLNRRTNRQYRRYIVAIKPIGKKPGICFKVAAKDGLYVAGRNYIVTHNSDALLMAALQYIDVPGYAALILRKSYADLSKAGALLDRANSWLQGTIMKKHDGGKYWTYPGGGRLEFGFVDSETDKFKYKSAEYQFCGFDEVSEIAEDDYTYLFSRTRKPAKHCPECYPSPDDVDHRKPKKTCKLCFGTGINPLHLVPLRQRSASNPGGVHGEWVKRHFIPKAYLQADPEQQFSNIWTKSGDCILCHGKKFIEVNNRMISCLGCLGVGHTERYFVPARLEDNASLDQASYEMGLASLSDQERAQLRHGRWDFMSDGTLFLREWVRQYGWRGEHIELYNPEGKRLLDHNSYITFLTADTASKIRTSNDYTVICAWALCVKTAALCLLEVFRKRILTTEILAEILRLRDRWKTHFTIIEEASSGITLIQEIMYTARGKGMTVIPYSPHTGDKVARAQEAMIRMRNGQIYFPDTRNETIAECINEMLLFYDPDAHDDFVDNLSQAAWYAGGRWRNKSVNAPGRVIRRGLPAPVSRFRKF